MINWNAVYNRLFKIIDRTGEPCYYSGPRFIQQVQEVKADFPDYHPYLHTREQAGLSTTRRDYYRDILLGLDESDRYRVVTAILQTVEQHDADLCSEVRAMMSGGIAAPSATVPAAAWNGDRLNEYLREMDAAIASGQYERAVTLSYTCLEGFLGAFVRAKSARASYPNEIVALSREVSDYLKSVNSEYPDEVLNLIKHSAHAVDRARNRFSESHFGGEAGRWLATYMRDLVNTQIRLLLHFM